MDILTMENFHAALEAEQEVREKSLFEALRSLRELSFSADDLTDGVDTSGWMMWT